MAIGSSGSCCSARVHVVTRKDSDYEVTVFLRDMADRFVEMNQLGDLSTQILDETGEFILATPYPAGSYNERMLEVRAVGVDL